MSTLSNYSPELKDLIEQPQNKMGIFVYCFLFAFIALLLLLSVIIESPDIVIAEAKVSSSNPPIVLKSKTVGRIHVIVDSIPVLAEPYNYLAVIDNAADYSDVLKLKNTLEMGWPIISTADPLNDDAMQVGELSSCYFSLKSAATKYAQLTNKNNDYHRQIALYSQRLEYDKKALISIKAALANSIKQLEIKEKQHKEDSILFTRKAITESQFQESCLNILNSQKYLITGQEEELAKEKSIEENRRQIENLQSEYEEVLANVKLEMNTKYKELLAQIKEWENRYIFMPTSSCTVEWANIISEGDYVEIGEPVFNCISPNNQPYAVAVLPGQMSGKVKVGQAVNIKLDAFPYAEYGMIKGCVDRISMNTIEKKYLLYLSLPNGLTSTSGQVLSFAETVYGQAEIITEKRRLITRIYHHIYDIISSREKIGAHKKDEDTRDSEIKF